MRLNGQNVRPALLITLGAPQKMLPGNWSKTTEIVKRSKIAKKTTQNQWKNLPKWQAYFLSCRRYIDSFTRHDIYLSFIYTSTILLLSTFLLISIFFPLYLFYLDVYIFSKHIFSKFLVYSYIYKYIAISDTYIYNQI